MLLRRYLSPEQPTDRFGMPYKKLNDRVCVVAYCLMPNHFHILLYQKEAGGMPRLMRGVMTAYSRYFNKKYNRSGSLFDSRYKASRIDSDEYLQHISRYIHLNPDNWQGYRYSSLPVYLGKADSDWLETERVVELFADSDKYLEFVSDYKDIRDVLEQIKHELAGY